MPSNKKIGIVANTAFNIFNFRLGLIEQLQLNGYKVIAIAPEDDYTKLLQEKNIEFVAVNQLARKGTNPWKDFLLMNELRKIYRQYQLDAVLQYTIKPNIYGTLAAKFSGTKTICTVTGLGYTFLNENWVSKIAHQLYKLAFSTADVVLFQNKDDLKIFIEEKLVDHEKTQLIPGSGIDTEKFHPDFCKQEKSDINFHPTPTEKIRFLMIGRLLKDKGVYEYIEAAKQILLEHKNVEFLLLGDIDNDNPTAIKQAELEHWVNEKIIIYIPHQKDIRPFICQADCVVLPSYREGMPRVILESMAMAKPCITTDTAGCRDAVVDNETGFICEVENAIALQQSIAKFINLPQTQKQSLGINARVRAERIFSQQIVIKQYQKLLEKLLSF
ncbi:MAG: glycosyltransferase family 4 protein [Bacteroidetes bacterium]|nr:glycosyltransferase family 4 protein [Bacteroidota bacterium]